MGRFLRRTHYNLLWDLEPYLNVCQAPLALLLFSLAELLLGPFGGASEPSLPRSTARVCLALPVMKRLDSGITKGIRLVIPYGFHSWVVGTVVSARDALENNGHLHEDVDGNSNLVTELVKTYVQPF